VQGEEGSSSLEQRPRRSHKPTEKLKDTIQSANAKRGRNDTTNAVYRQYAVGMMPMHDILPDSEMPYYSVVAQLDNEDNFSHSEVMPDDSEMSPDDMARSSSEMFLNTMSLEGMEQTPFEDDLSSASASSEEFIDFIM